MNKNKHIVIYIEIGGVKSYLKSYTFRQSTVWSSRNSYVFTTDNLDEAKVFRTDNGAFRTINDVLYKHYNKFDVSIYQKNITTKELRLMKLKELNFYE